MKRRFSPGVLILVVSVILSCSTGKGQNIDLKTASKKDVMAALSASAQQSAASTPQMVAAIMAARKDLARDVLRIAITSARAGGCSQVSAIASAAVAADPANAASTMELSARLAPNCTQALEQATAQASDDEEDATTSAKPATKAGKAAKAATARRKRKCAVCHNDHTVLLPCGQVNKFLRHHPGDRAGDCEATPVTNL